MKELKRKINRILKWPVLLAPFILAGGCTDEGDLFDPGFREHPEIESMSIVPIDQHTFIPKDITSGDMGTMVLGETGGIKASILLRFDLHDSLSQPIFDSPVVQDSVSIVVYAEEGGPDDVVGSVTYSMELCAAAWSESTLVLRVDDDSEIRPGSGQEIAEGTLYNTTVPYYDGMFFPMDGFMDWIDDPEDNFGLLISPTDTLSVLFIDTEEGGGDEPRLMFSVSDSTGRFRKAVVEPSDDTYIVEITDEDLFDDYSEADTSYSDRLVLGNGWVQRAALLFDFADVIPEGSTVNKATLSLHIREEMSAVANPGFGLEFYSLTEENWQGEFPEIDGEDGLGGGERIPGTIEDLFDSEDDALLDSILVNVRVPVQEWINDQDGVFGFLMKTTRERTDISYVSIWHSPPDSLTGMEPKLEILYTPPASGRFNSNR